MFRFVKDSGLLVVFLLVLVFLLGGSVFAFDPPPVTADPPPVVFASVTVNNTAPAQAPALFPVLRQMVCDGAACRLVAVPQSQTQSVSFTTAAPMTATSSTALSACESCGGVATTSQTVSYQQMETAQTVTTARRFTPFRKLFSRFRLFGDGGCQ